jgi:hypothetical protein
MGRSPLGWIVVAKKLFSDEDLFRTYHEYDSTANRDIEAASKRADVGKVYSFPGQIPPPDWEGWKPGGQVHP